MSEGIPAPRNVLTSGGWVKSPPRTTNTGGEKVRLYVQNKGQEEAAKKALQTELNLSQMGGKNRSSSDNSLHKYIYTPGSVPTETPYLLKEGNVLRFISEAQAADLSRPATIIASASLLSSTEIGTGHPIKNDVTKRDPQTHFVDLKEANPQSRLGSVDQLNQAGNLLLTSLDSFSELESRGNGYGLKASPNNPFRATLEGGQIRWRSESPVDGLQVAEVVIFTNTHHRNLHINTGTHGDSLGNTVIEKIQLGEAKFSKEDLTTVWNLPNVSIHIVSQYAPAFVPQNMDVIDAWCYSDVTYHRPKEGDWSLSNIFTALYSFLSRESAEQKIIPQSSMSTPEAPIPGSQHVIGGVHSQTGSAVGQVMSTGSGNAIGIASGQGAGSTYQAPVTFGPASTGQNGGVTIGTMSGGQVAGHTMRGVQKPR